MNEEYETEGFMLSGSDPFDEEDADEPEGDDAEKLDEDEDEEALLKSPD